MKFKFKRKPQRALISSTIAVVAFVYAVVHFYDVPLINFGNVMVVAFLLLFVIIVASVLFVSMIKLVKHLLNRS